MTSMKGVDYGITVGLELKNSGVAWFDLVLVTCLCTMVVVILLVDIRY